MEEIKTQNTGNILLLIFISMAILLLVGHLTIQIIETNKSAEKTTKNDMSFPKNLTEPIKADSIWHNTEFIKN